MIPYVQSFEGENEIHYRALIVNTAVWKKVTKQKQ